MEFIGLIEVFLMLIGMFVMLILPAIALVDILKSRFEGNDSIIMVLIVIFLPIIGPFIYFTIGVNRKIK